MCTPMCTPTPPLQLPPSTYLPAHAALSLSTMTAFQPLNGYTMFLLPPSYPPPSLAVSYKCTSMDSTLN